MGDDLLSDASCGMEAGPVPPDMAMACGNVSIASSLCLARANSRMHDKMAMQYSCDSLEADFLRGMIPHHQGAIDMCNILLKFGDPVDPVCGHHIHAPAAHRATLLLVPPLCRLLCFQALRTLCEGWESPHDYLKGVIPSQSKEIAQMRKWLANRGYDEGTACSSLPHNSMGGGGTLESGMMSHGDMSEDTEMGGHAADDAACGIPSRISDRMPSRLKFGVSVGEGSRRERRQLIDMAHSTDMFERRQLMDMAHGTDMFGCGETSCMSTRCYIHVSFAASSPWLRTRH